MSERIERGLQITPASKDVEDCFSFLLFYSCNWWCQSPCLRGHCFLASDLFAKPFRVHYYASPFGVLAHVFDPTHKGL